jgi:DNA-nicking Smr family endonuclease
LGKWGVSRECGCYNVCVALEDDFEAFAREMSGVTPLSAEARERVRPAPNTAVPGPRPDPDAEAYAALADLVAGNARFDVADTGEFVCGLAPGVDRRLLRALRRGEYAVQAHVDLHGLRTEEAKRAVDEFIRDSRRASRRCVLVVHGRGLRSKDHIPVLKEKLSHWLSSGRIGKQVLCFATARPHDGGAGAMYVLLRR